MPSELHNIESELANLKAMVESLCSVVNNLSNENKALSKALNDVHITTIQTKSETAFLKNIYTSASSNAKRREDLKLRKEQKEKLDSDKRIFKLLNKKKKTF